MPPSRSLLPLVFEHGAGPCGKASCSGGERFINSIHYATHNPASIRRGHANCNSRCLQHDDRSQHERLRGARDACGCSSTEMRGKRGQRPLTTWNMCFKDPLLGEGVARLGSSKIAIARSSVRRPCSSLNPSSSALWGPAGPCLQGHPLPLSRSAHLPARPTMRVLLPAPSGSW